MLNPRIDELENSTLDMVVAGTADAVLMVESEAQSLSEEEMLGAVMFAQRESRPVIDAIISLAEDCAKDPWALDPPDPAQAELEEKVREISEATLRDAYAEQVKQARVEKVSQAKAGAREALGDSYPADAVAGALKTLEKDIVRNAILDTGGRIDGRDTRTVRPIQAEVGILPRLHGSALFTRGETQAIVVATLGTGQDEQIIDALEGEYREHFMLHYNFPPYSVGEASFLRSPGRREIGHGKLAWRAVRAMMPSKEDFPLHGPRGLRDHRVQRLVLDGDGMRRFAGDDGRGRADQGAGRRHRHGADQGGRPLRRPFPTFSATRIISATWTSRSPAPATV